MSIFGLIIDNQIVAMENFILFIIIIATFHLLSEFKFFKEYLFIHLFGCVGSQLWDTDLVAPWLGGS